jgi:hypothetical protein
MNRSASGRQLAAAFAERKRRLRGRSEHVLRLAAMDDMARRYPARTVPPALSEEGPFWRLVFVPLYRRVPWEFKRDAMRRLKMTAQGWPEESRRFGEPWGVPTPPVGSERSNGAPPRAD